MLTRPDILLRAESGALLVVSTLCYPTLLHGKWSWFFLLFLIPDISLLGYAGGNKRAAAAFYNTVHNYLGPASLGFASWKSSWLVGEQLASIWIAHIAFDRLLGFGLKYPVAFKPTHLQVLNAFRRTGSTED
jgi:Domain of unknown function (DUF4260)